LVFLILIALLIIIYSLTGKNLFENTSTLTLGTGVLLLIVGFFAGWYGSLIGVGGGVILLPVLHFCLGFPAPLAVGTSMITVMFTSASGGYAHFIRGNVSVLAGKWIAPTGIAGVILGSCLFTHVTANTALLELILGIAFIIPSILMIGESLYPEGFRKNSDPDKLLIKPAALSLMGLISGTLTGLLGLGGGYLLVPALIYIFHIPVYLTMGTSMAVIFPISVIGSILKLSGGYVDIYAALIASAGTIVGAQIGADTIKRFQPKTLKLIFSIYFFYISLKFILQFI